RLSIRDRLPQLEVATGESGTRWIVRHLRPVNERDRATLTELQATIKADIWVKGEGDPEPLDDSGAELNFALPGDLRLSFTPQDFIQANAPVNRQLIDRALDWLELRGDQRVVDLFCGLGNFTLPLATRAADVVGVEIDEAMVARARKNAKDNQLTNARFIAADLMDEEADWPKALRQTLRHVDAVLLDPPRAGAMTAIKRLVPALSSAVSGDAPARILYVSCNPATLARDAGFLVNAGGYRLQRLCLADMFPHTTHSEAMALFVRGEAPTTRKAVKRRVSLAP
ncbi:unnamed protein product, partial [Cyprideis torosa]